MKNSQSWPLMHGIFLCSVLVLLLAAGPVTAVEFSVVTFNVESDDDTDPHKVAEDIARIEPTDLWGLQEVNGQAELAVLVAAIGPGYRTILGKSGDYASGKDDNLAIVFNPDILELIDARELVEADGTRKPLIARFALRQSGQKFIFMVNHLQRDRYQVRQNQARYLNAWARRQILPVVAVGHYNFDWNLRRRQGNLAFDLMRHNEAFKWVPPTCLQRGDCPPTGSQCDPRFSRLQAFIFVTGPAKDYLVETDLLFLDDPGYCEREIRGHAAHRPLRAVIRIESAG